MDRRSFAKGLAASLAVPLLGGPAEAQLVRKYAEQLNNGEFNWFPERSLSGPLLIIVSIPDQKVHVYRNGIRVAASTCTTGKPGHRTPTGVFKILQKDKYHRSNIYSNAPMPNMQRLTWSGIALHAGNLPGYPASHGCVRLPMGFSELLFGITRKGMTVVLADNNSQPAAVVHPKLVLEDTARQKFDAVDAGIHSAARDVDRNSDLTHTSLVISGRDRRATLYENDQVVARSKVEIANPDLRLADAAYQLNRTNRVKQEMHWSQIAFDKKRGDSLKSDLPRIKTSPDFTDEFHRRAHLGMTLVTTADRHRPRNSTDDGFVVIDGIY
jgi:L,D-transpeptidase catalytic domain